MNGEQIRHERKFILPKGKIVLIAIFVGNDLYKAAFPKPETTAEEVAPRIVNLTNDLCIYQQLFYSVPLPIFPISEAQRKTFTFIRSTILPHNSGRSPQQHIAYCSLGIKKDIRAFLSRKSKTKSLVHFTTKIYQLLRQFCGKKFFYTRYSKALLEKINLACAIVRRGVSVAPSHSDSNCSS